MRVLVAWAGDASPNLGVRALAQGSADLLHRAWPDADVEFLNYGQRPDAVPFGQPRSLMRERVTGKRGMMRWLSEFDLFWDTRSGDSFADIYGLQRHTVMSLLHEFAGQAGVPTAIAPQTIGPFDTRRGRLLARRTLKRSTKVYAREQTSARAAAALGRPVDAVTSDLVFAITAPDVTEQRDVILNVSGLLWHPNTHVDSATYRSTIRETLAGLLAAGRTVTLLPHVLEAGNADTDVATAHALAAEVDAPVEVVVPTSLAHARATIAGSRLLIGARMHACLNALSTGVPAIAMAYSRKFAPLLGELGWEHVLPIDAEGNAETILALSADDSLAEKAGRARAQGQGTLTALADELAAWLPG